MVVPLPLKGWAFWQTKGAGGGGLFKFKALRPPPPSLMAVGTKKQHFSLK